MEIFVINNSNNKYVNDMIKCSSRTITILSKRDELVAINSELCLVLVQNLFDTDIDCEILIKIKQSTNCKMYTCIHDFSWFNTTDVINHEIYLEKDIKVNRNSKKLFESCNGIIFPSNFMLTEYKKYFNSYNFIHAYYNDIPLSIRHIKIRVIDSINIGVFNDLISYKGIHMINYLMIKYAKYKGITIKFIIPSINAPCLTDENFFKVIEEYNIHGVTMLNSIGESYSYELTKCLNSGLPMIYNNIGSFKERIPVSNHYFSVFDNVYDISTKHCFTLDRVFEKFLDYLLNGEENKYNKCSTEVVPTKFYSKLLCL